MTIAAHKYDLALPTPSTTPMNQDFVQRGIQTDIVILGVILACLQILDGVLTGIGIAHFGIAAEGNFLLRGLMEIIGYIPALLFVKTFAIGIVATLCVLASRVSWLKRAMQMVAALYVGAAVLPWTAIILTRIIYA